MNRSNVLYAKYIGDEFIDIKPLEEWERLGWTEKNIQIRSQWGFREKYGAVDGRTIFVRVNDNE